MNYQEQLARVPSNNLRKLKDKHDHYRAESSAELIKAIREELARRKQS